MTTNLSKEELATRYTNALKASEANKELNTNNYYTPKEMAKEYNLSTNTVYQWLFRELIPAKRQEGKIFIDKHVAASFVKQRKELNNYIPNKKRI